MKKYFISFANTSSNFSSERIVYEAKKMNVFDEIIFYTENDFDSEFIERCGKKILDNKRGYGYWCWKPYIIKKTLEKINYGDIVVYADAGCTFNSDKAERMNEWFDLLLKSQSGVLSPCFGPYTEYEWTRADLFDYVNRTYNTEGIEIFENTLQYGAGQILFYKSDKSVDFVNKWYDIMTRHFELCTDAPSAIQNHKKFKENRHDQSAFSLLAKIYNVDYIEGKNGGSLDKNNAPLYASQIRTDKYTWKQPNT